MNITKTTNPGDLSYRALELSTSMRDALLWLARGGDREPLPRSIWALVSRGLVEKWPQGTDPKLTSQGYRVAAWVLVAMRGGHGWDYVSQDASAWLAQGYAAAGRGDAWEAHLCASCAYLHANELATGDAFRLARQIMALETEIHAQRAPEGPERPTVIDDKTMSRILAEDVHGLI